MIRIILLVTILLITSSVVWGEEIESIQDKELVHVLTNFEIIAERKELPLWVRILRVQDHGECDGSPGTCPLSTIYLAVSEFDEFPEQKVFRLPKRHSWAFVSWQKEANGFVVLELEAKVPSAAPQRGWWASRYYVIKVNSKEASIFEKAAL